jgi:hypothetical protein
VQYAHGVLMIRDIRLRPTGTARALEEVCNEPHQLEDDSSDSVKR